MNLFFLQVIIDSSKIKDSLARAGIIPAPGKQNLWDILERGGPLMIPLALLLVIAVFVFIERVMAINKASKTDENFMNIIRDHIVNNNVMAARSLAKNTNNSIARMIDKGIQRIGKPIDAIEKSMENVGRLELYKMEKNVSILSVIGYIAPLIWISGNHHRDVPVVLQYCLHRGIQYFQYCRGYLCENDFICRRVDYRDHCLYHVPLPEFTD